MSQRLLHSRALYLAQRHERDPHEFDAVEIVAESSERTHIVDDVFAYAVLLKSGRATTI